MTETKLTDEERKEYRKRIEKAEKDILYYERELAQAKIDKKMLETILRNF